MSETAHETVPHYRNYYRCTHCDTYWSDDWSCQCDDRCPNCDASMQPYDSDDLHEPAEEYLIPDDGA